MIRNSLPGDIESLHCIARRSTALTIAPLYGDQRRLYTDNLLLRGLYHPTSKVLRIDWEKSHD